MKLENRRFDVKRTHARLWIDELQHWARGNLKDGEYPLRFFISSCSDDRYVVDATLLKFPRDHRFAETFSDIEILSPRKKQFSSPRFGVVQVVPTGVGCEIGGYAGDACPVTNVLSNVADFVITHPNVVNASELNEMSDGVLYVEGKSLDDFLLGRIGLRRTVGNRIGTFIDRTGADMTDQVLNAINAACAAGGIDCEEYFQSIKDLGVNVEWTESGCAVGRLDNPMSLIDGVERIIERGATAVGIVSALHGITTKMFVEHLHGQTPNPSGGVEAIISHLVSKIYRIPVAHSPLPYYQGMKQVDTVNPRASAEFISIPHYFCVLKGLSKAPNIVTDFDLSRYCEDVISINDIGAIVIPSSCLGGIPAIAAEYSNIPLITVRQNASILDMTNAKMKFPNVIEVESYMEATGVICAMRSGISLRSVRRPIHPPHEIPMEGAVH